MARQAAHKVEFIANPIQKLFIESQAKADLFSSRMGEGKSAGIAWSCFYHTRHNPGASWAIIRDTWENLRDTTMKEFFYWFPPGVFGNYIASEKRFVWTVDGMGGGDVSFLGMDDPGDASKLQSRALGGFAIDEPAPAAESGGVDEMIFDVALSRLRQKGMNWYAAKLATNNPDETHWTYRRFGGPTADKRFRLWQPTDPENVANLPPDYYADLRAIWTHRPDLVRRFVEGVFGFQQIGRQVTPEWDDLTHLAVGLIPVKSVPLTMSWDFGLNPTCLITQLTPMGHWNFLESFVGEEMGVLELIEDVVKPRLAERYRKFTWRHTGDPQGTQREQSSSKRTAVRVIRAELGGGWRSGPINIPARVDPLRAVLRQRRGSSGLVQVDRVNAKEVWHALRGGWHYHVARTGIVSAHPVKNIHSHPGDAAGYAAAIMFPLGKVKQRKGQRKRPVSASFQQGLGFEQPGLRLPHETRTIEDNRKSEIGERT